MFISSSRNFLILRSIETPVKRLRLEAEGEGRKNVLSPTANLPNLVRDGLGGSSSRTPTPLKRKGAAPSDWLTNLSRDQLIYGRREMAS